MITVNPNMSIKQLFYVIDRLQKSVVYQNEQLIKVKKELETIKKRKSK